MSRVVSFFWRLILQRKPTTVIVGKYRWLLCDYSYTTIVVQDDFLLDYAIILLLSLLLPQQPFSSR